MSSITKLCYLQQIFHYKHADRQEQEKYVTGQLKEETNLLLHI